MKKATAVKDLFADEQTRRRRLTMRIVFIATKLGRDFNEVELARDIARRPIEDVQRVLDGLMREYIDRHGPEKAGEDLAHIDGIEGALAARREASEDNGR